MVRLLQAPIATPDSPQNWCGPFDRGFSFALEDYSTLAGMENGALLLPFSVGAFLLLGIGSLVRVFGVLGFRTFWPLACVALWTGLSAFW